MVSKTTRKGNRSTLLDKAASASFVGRLRDSGGLVNLGGNYDYMSRPYYVSQDFENEGRTIRPSCTEMLDAYVPPLFLEKTKRFGVSVAEYYISNGYFEPPVIVDPINPFTLKGRVIMKPGKVKQLATSLTRNFTYAVCCQELPEGARVGHFRSVLGWSANPRYRSLSAHVWEIFSIPLARVRVITLKNGECLLSDLAPLWFDELNARELRIIEERVSWDS